jgi:hypothetical protein
MTSKFENTVVTALRQGWFIEEIEQLIPSIEAMTVHNIAKRHRMKARHCPKGFMRLKAMAATEGKLGAPAAAAEFHITTATFRASVSRYWRLEKERKQCLSSST